MNQPDQDEKEESSARDAMIGKAFLWSLLGFALLGGGVAGGVWWIQREPAPGEQKQTQFAPALVEEEQVAPIPHAPLVDVTEYSGVRFQHENGAEGEVLWPELIGSGCALIDYDGDGKLDIFFANCTRWPWSTRPRGEPSRLALYRNLGGMKFVDVTKEANLDHTLFAHGTAVGDYDNDGDSDLFVSATGENRMFRNDGGRFEDVTAVSGLGGDPDDLSTSCTWIDFDNDGDLDLFVGNYFIWSREIDLSRSYRTESGVAPAIGPQQYEGDQSCFYRNEGRGLFTDISEEVGIHVVNPETGKGVGRPLAVAIADLNGDHWLDIVVANDTTRNFAYMNQRNGTFVEMAERIGVAVGPYGGARAGMGIDVGDIRNDGSLAIAIGNFGGESSGMFISSKRTPEEVIFTDEAIGAGIGAATRKPLTFAVVFFDFDLDGRLDFMQSNGHVNPEIEKASEDTHAQPAQLFWNWGDKGKFDFAPVTSEHVGEAFFRPMVARGSAYGDLDGDGDLDLVVTSTGQAARIFRNDQRLGHHWVRLQLEGVKANRDAIGAKIYLKVGGRVLHRMVSPTHGFLSQSETSVTIGLGNDDKIDELRIVWPGGEEQIRRGLKIDQVNVVRQGQAD